MATRAFKFGIGKPPTGLDREKLLREMVEAHHFKNRLIAVERYYRQKIREIQYQHPIIGPLTKELNEVNEQIKAKTREIHEKYECEHKKYENKIKELKSLKVDSSEIKKIEDDIESFDSKMEKEIKKECKPLYSKSKEIVKRIKLEKEKSTDLLEEYSKVEEVVEEITKIVGQPQDKAESLRYKEVTRGMSHGSPQWPTKGYVNRVMRGAKSARFKRLGEEDDPQFERMPTKYLSWEIGEGTIATGINQTKKKNSGPLSKFTTKNDKGEPSSRVFYMDPIDPRAYDPKTPRCERKKLCRTNAMIRIDTKRIEKKSGKKIVVNTYPIWAELKDVIIHRQIPDDAMIIDIVLKYENVGLREKWFLVFTLESDTFEKPVKKLNKRGVAAVQFDWSGASDGHITAVYAGSDGKQDVIAVDSMPRLNRRILSERGNKINKYITGFNKTDSGLEFANAPLRREKRTVDTMFKSMEGVRAAQDHNMKRLNPVYDYVEKSQTLPRCLNEVKGHLHKWRSTSRLQRLFQCWKNQRVQGDDTAFSAMEEWSKADKHLYSWHRNLESRIVNRRNDTFWKVAHDLCSRYEKIFVDNIDLTKVATKDSDELRLVGQNIRRVKGRASPGRFREILKHAAGTMGTEIVMCETKRSEKACEMLSRLTKDFPSKSANDASDLTTS